MIKKIISFGVMLLLMFSMAACNNGGGETPDKELLEYKSSAKTEIGNYALDKGQENYTTENWLIILDIDTKCKEDIGSAVDKAEVDALLIAAKTAIDAVDEGEEMADFILTISVDNNTKNLGEDFVVEVCLKNQSGADVSISYYHSPVAPFIENWKYPHSPLEPSEPDVIVIENGGTFQETWNLGAYGYTNPITEEKSSLPIGIHELKFRTIITVDQSEIIIYSNTIKLTVK